MISKELNSADSRFARICSTALRSVFCSSRPTTVAPISPGRQKKLQPASWIFRFKPHPSRSLTNLQPGTQGSHSNRRVSGKSVPSLIRMVPGLIVSGIWALLGVYSGTLFGSWRRRLVVSLDSIFVTGPSCRFSLEGALTFRPNGRCNSLREGSTNHSYKLSSHWMIP
jgi:hypothetical protein